jgi:hypothetical protein
MKQTTTIYKLLFLPVALLLAGCTDYEADTVDTPEILFRTGVTQVTEGTRAITYDSVEELEAERSFTCAVYDAGTPTPMPFISPTRVDWTGSGNLWEFSDGKHKWPKQGSLDFFAFFPADMPFTHSLGTPSTTTVSYSPTPTLTCIGMPVDNIPNNSTVDLTPSDNTKEFVYAIAKGLSQDGNGETGVRLDFKHVFARLKFTLSADNGTNVTVNRITIPDVYCNGTCTLGDSPSWSVDPSTDDLVITGTSATATYLVIPYDYSYNKTVKKTITVNATWHGWTELTKDVSTDVYINWELGTNNTYKLYTYKLTLDNYVLQVDKEKYTEQW